MKINRLSRRDALGQTGMLISGAVLAEPLTRAIGSPAPVTASAGAPFRFCLNMATIRGQKLGLIKEIEVAASAGYDAIEPWVDSIQQYVKNGGEAADLKKRIADAGLTVESAIGFPDWIV